MADIGVLPGGTLAKATSIDGDGSIIVGNGDSASGTQRAFEWTASGGMMDLGALAGATESYANAVNADGSVIVGSSGTSLSNQHPVRWVDGVIQDMGLFPGSTSTVANAVSPEGNVVVGDYSVPAPVSQRAFIWRSDSGYQDLGQYADSLGIHGYTGPDVYLEHADAVSSGGLAIAGYEGGNSPHYTGFVLYANPVPEPASVTVVALGVVGLLRRRLGIRRS